MKQKLSRLHNETASVKFTEDRPLLKWL